ncbi:MAG: cell division ATP-binding protein FtsE [Paludibacter sp.]
MEKTLLIKYKNVDIFQQDYLVLKNVNLEVHAGEFIYLLGKVGSGKSSLLKSFYCDVLIQNGVAGVLDYNLHQIKLNEIPFLRRKIGIVFQDFQLLTDRSVYSNLEFVLKATGWEDKAAINEQIDNVLTQVGMLSAKTKMPFQLSGGEQQRIVIARALLNSPEIILADEPTGHLDPETGNELVDLLYNISKSGTTVIMATHNLNWLLAFPGRILRFDDNMILEVKNLDSIETVKVKVIADNNSIMEETVVVDDDE